MDRRKEDRVDKYRVRIEFVEECLGVTPKDKEIWTKHVAPQPGAEDELTEEAFEEELESIVEVDETGWTGFPEDDEGRPIFWDYQWKGFFKDACGSLRRAKGFKSAKLGAYKKVIDGLLFVTPRKIPLDLHGAEMGTCERPLRASTPQGDRVALAKSDTVPAGTTTEFEVLILGQISEPLLREWLDYGALKGTGQWRNSGKGRFIHVTEKIT